MFWTLYLLDFFSLLVFFFSFFIFIGKLYILLETCLNLEAMCLHPFCPAFVLDNLWKTFTFGLFETRQRSDIHWCQDKTSTKVQRSTELEQELKEICLDNIGDQRTSFGIRDRRIKLNRWHCICMNTLLVYKLSRGVNNCLQASAVPCKVRKAHL